MAKLSIPINTQNDPEVDVVAEDIASALARLSWLLEGRIDYDNIAKIIDGSEERPLQIPASKVQDIPLISNEINCNKFIGSDSQGNSFINMVWNPIKNKVLSNPIFTVISASEFITITKDTLIFQNKVFGNTGDNSGANKYKDFRIEIEIPKTFVPVRYKRFLEMVGDSETFFDTVSGITYTEEDVAISYEYFADCKDSHSNTKSWNVKQPTYDPIKNKLYLDITINIGVGGNFVLEDDEYINIALTMSVLCEERI